jgi:hypothetical protein
MVRKIPLELARQVFPTNLLILKGQGIDIILGMRWMKMHKALLDISAHLVHLDSPASGKVTLHIPVVPGEVVDHLSCVGTTGHHEVL